jgi:hypothetical protein
MPKNYQNTSIYKIICNDANITDVYVGSTINFNKRKYSHKTSCMNENSKSHNYKIYQMIRQNGGWDNWTMLEIEKYPCNNSDEAHARERHHYDILNSTLNTLIPNRKATEYYITNRDKLIEYQKQYDRSHKDKKKEYYEANKDKLKEYYETNKDKIRQYKKQHYQFKKERDNYIRFYNK